jgi:hypothetical protein
MSDDSGIDWMESSESQFKKAMAETVEMAKKENRICSLYLSKFGVHKYIASCSRWDDWLFRAYPGGRKSLSNAGKKHLKDCKI